MTSQLNIFLEFGWNAVVNGVKGGGHCGNFVIINVKINVIMYF